MAGFHANPLVDGSLAAFRVHPVEMARLTLAAVEGLGLTSREAERCKNFFALGMAFWLYRRDMKPTLKFLQEKFGGKRPELAEANLRALKAGHGYCDANPRFEVSYEVPPATLPPGKYRNITGNTATVLGMIAAGQKSGLRVFLGSYPITPASDILHLTARYKNFGVWTAQAEDEISAVCMAIGAAYGGALAFTATSGPGFDLKSESIGMAVMAELPLVICDVQRAGPSTGLPTKTEQSDLLAACYGRHGESPVPILAPSRPSDCFQTVYDCARIAVKYMTPVIMLSDLYLALGAEPWRIPASGDLPPIEVKFRADPEGFKPYERDPETLARPWVLPGTPGLEHRIGGLEKEDGAGGVSYDPENHQRMCVLRAEKVERIAREIPPTRVDGPESGDLLVVGWGSTYGAIRAAVRAKQVDGQSVSQVHLRHLNPLPPDLGGILSRFRTVLVPEVNLGQLVRVLRGRYLAPAIGLNKVRGQPFDPHDIEDKIDAILRGEPS
jgi:2-oxoglutarate ferredoxin oxidoreductase subunit alpha